MNDQNEQFSLSVLIHAGTKSAPGCVGTSDPAIWRHLLFINGAYFVAELKSDLIDRQPKHVELVSHFYQYLRHPANPWRFVRMRQPLLKKGSENAPGTGGLPGPSEAREMPGSPIRRKLQPPTRENFPMGQDRPQKINEPRVTQMHTDKPTGPRKRCTMNCGQARNDTRTRAEMMRQCEDCADAPEIIAGGICDGCGNEHTYLQVCDSPGVAVGICLCRGCLETDGQNDLTFTPTQ